MNSTSRRRSCRRHPRLARAEQNSEGGLLRGVPGARPRNQLQVSWDMRLSAYVTDAQTRARMKAVRTRDTDPEMVVRKALRSLGLHFRLHRADLPGRPDIVIPSLRLAVFVNGCFWHRHSCPKGRSQPRRNRALWQSK